MTPGPVRAAPSTAAARPGSRPPTRADRRARGLGRRRPAGSWSTPAGKPGRGPGPGRPAGGGGAPPVRTRPVAVPLPRAGGGPAGSHPATGDRAGGGGGPGRAGLADRRPPATRAGRAGHGPVAVDLGTGSGAIALSLAVEGGAVAPGLVVWATDASADALEVAAWNRDELARWDPSRRRPRPTVGGPVVRRTAGGAGRDGRPPGVQPPLRGRGRVRPPRPDGQPVGAPRRPGGGRRWRSGRDGRHRGRDRRRSALAAAAGALVVEIDPAQADATLDAVHRAGFARSGTAQDLAGRVRMVVARR